MKTGNQSKDLNMRNTHSQKASHNQVITFPYLGDPNSPSTVYFWTQKLGFRAP